MRFGALLVVLFLGSCTQPPSARVLEYGLYKKVSTGAKSFVVTGPDKREIPTGKVELLETTTRVPGRLGICFGYRYEIDLKKKPIEIKVIYRHPRLADDTGRESEGYSFVMDIGVLGESSWRGADHYCFDHPGEIKPGRWSFEVRHGDVLLVHQEFEVTAE